MFRLILFVLLATKVLAQSDSLHEGSFKVKKKQGAIINLCDFKPSKVMCLPNNRNDSIVWPFLPAIDPRILHSLFNSENNYLNKKAKKMAKSKAYLEANGPFDKSPKGIYCKFSIVINADGTLGSIESIEAPDTEFKIDVEVRIYQLVEKNWKPATLWDVPVSSINCFRIYYGKSRSR